MNEVVQFGHRELWVVSEGDWSLPIFCDPYTSDAHNVTHWAVRPAVELLVAPFTELSTRFAPINLGSEAKSWIVEDRHLLRLAMKAKGCMPKDYLKWSSDKPGKETDGRELIMDSDKDDEFLRFVCQRSSLDMPLGRFVWRAIKDGMLHWFKNTQKPVHFELFTIHPMPYRANWKEIMLSKHSDTPYIFRKKRQHWRSGLVSSGFIEDLGSADLMAMNKNRTFSWTLDIQMHKLLLDELADGEKERLSSKRPVRYAKYYESTIRKRLSDIIEVYAGWLRQVEQPVGSVRESVQSSDPVLVPTSKRCKVLPSWHRPNEVTYQPRANVPQLKQGYRPVKRMEKALKDMFQVPNIQPVIEDVRGLPEPADVDGPGHNGNGTGGVRVRNVGEVETNPCRLLAEGEVIEL